MKNLTAVLEKRLRRIAKKQKYSFYDKLAYKLYRHYTKKEPDQELLVAVKNVLYPNKNNSVLLNDIVTALNKLTDLERENVRLLKYSMLSTELKSAYNSGKIENIDETLKYQSYQERYKISLHKIRLKHEAGEKVRVGFLVVFDSVFPMEALYKKMLKDDFFDPKIVVIFHTAQGMSRMEKTYSKLKEKYGDNVIFSFKKETHEFIDFDDQFDLITTANPYEIYAHPLSSTQHFAELGIPTFWADYVPLFTDGQKSLIMQSQQNLTWKIFPLEMYEQACVMNNHLAGTNSVFLGWAKMDALAEIERKKQDRKKIILAPHHMVSNAGYHPLLSTFEKYADFFLTLPERYPQIDWVFRPHPVMFSTLKNNRDWGEQRCQEYIEKMKSFSNVEYQDSGSYFDTFINSDGMIHDCFSFCAEYMFTGHPCCFCKKHEGYQNVNEFFEKCVDHHYIAFEEQDIIDFIENVILKDNDPMKEARNAFFESDLKGSYPYSTDAILKCLKDEIRNA